MRGLWIVIRRELAVHRLLLVASALFGGFVAAMPWLAGASRPAELRGAGGLVGVGLWGLALAVGLGVTAVATPLAARRLAFDFRLPLSPAAIWLGRLAAGAIVVLAGAGLTILVPLPFGLDLGGAAGALDVFVERALPGQQELQGLLPLAPLLLLAIFLLAHTAGVAFAGARRGLALALAAVLAAKVGVWLAWRQLGVWSADVARWQLLAGALAGSVVVLVAASWAAARGGRAEPDRASRALVPWLLAGGLLLAGAALGWAHWITTPGIEALLAPVRERALDENWSVVSGRARGRGDLIFGFLRSSASGDTVALGSTVTPFHHLEVHRSADGSTLAWLERVETGTEAVVVRRLDALTPGAAPRATGIAWPGPPYSWALSPAGDEVLAFRGADRYGPRLERQSVASGELAGVVPVPPCRWADGPIAYVDRETARVACTAFGDDGVPAAPRRFEVDLATGRIVELDAAP